MGRFQVLVVTSGAARAAGRGWYPEGFGERACPGVQETGLGAQLGAEGTVGSSRAAARRRTFACMAEAAAAAAAASLASSESGREVRGVMPESVAENQDWVSQMKQLGSAGMEAAARDS